MALLVLKALIVSLQVSILQVRVALGRAILTWYRVIEDGVRITSC
jgi:hypothetical protein